MAESATTSAIPATGISTASAAAPIVARSEPIPTDPLIRPDPALPILKPWYDLKEKANNDLDLKISPSYTLLYQAADHVIPDEAHHDLFQGRADLFTDWTLFKDGRNTGSFVFLARSGENIGTAQSFALSPAVGDDLGIDSLQGGGENHPISVNLLYWRQSFFDDKLALYLGKIHPNQYTDLDPFNNDETTQFLGSPFDGNPSNPQLGNYSVGAAAEYKFTEVFYIHGLAMDSQGASNLPPNTTFDGKYYEAVEVGAKPIVDGLGKGNYRLTGWHDQQAGGGEGSGISVGFSQEIGEGWAPFGRWGYGDPEVSGIMQLASGGIANISPFGRRGDMFGLGVSWGDPSDHTLRQEVFIETFYRLKITDSLEFSPDVELLLPPADRDAQSTVWIFGARLKATF